MLYYIIIYFTLSLCKCFFTMRMKTKSQHIYREWRKFTKIYKCVCVCVFQEAHKMVKEANVKQANAEKQLKEALGKVTTLNTHSLQRFL